MRYENLDKAPAFSSLCSAEPTDVKTALNAERIRTYTARSGGGLSFNYAAMPVSAQTLGIFQQLCDQQQLIDKYKLILGGEVMNTGEKRKVLHHLLRMEKPAPELTEASKPEWAFYKEQLGRVRLFASKIRSGEITGPTGKPFDTVCQIGIGGSDLGPRALYLALEGWCRAQGIPTLKGVFISNVDPDDAAKVLGSINPETTLFVLVSKSGTTLETLTNRDLVMSSLSPENRRRQLVAVTSQTSPLAHSEGVLDAFFIDDFIGGRFSATSAVGAVVLSCSLSFDVFKAVLDGAREADRLALEPSVLKNAAMLHACINLYLRDVLNCPSRAVLPYSQALERFPAHLQQLLMESNGKRVSRDGQPVSYPTEPVIFGEPGTNGQHSFYQLLHQGTDIVPMDFIGFARSQRRIDVTIEGSTSQEKLVANLIAQIAAFALGKDDADPNRRFGGNRYSCLIHGKELSPQALGALLAHYENVTMFEGFLWNLNSFDQEGVQLGKKLAKKVLSGCEGDEVLLEYCRQMEN